jgi:hypothetical protein
MSTAFVSRRRALALLGALGTAIVPAVGIVARERTQCPAALSEDMDVAALRELAASFKARYPQEASAGAARAILRDGSKSDGQVLAELRRRVTEDYGQDRMVELAGWHISHTEAQVIVALSECPA